MEYNKIYELLNTDPSQATQTPERITSEAQAHLAIRAKKYIIGSFTQGGGFSFNQIPTVQPSATAARTECRRLAKLNPGKTFFFVQLLGAEQTVPQPTIISI